MSNEHIVHVTSENWKAEVLDSSAAVLVDFWAEWCGPCKMMGKVLEEMAPEMAGKIKIAKVDVDENQDLAAEFRIRSIPTLLVFKGGAVQEQIVGAMSKAALSAKLAPYV